MTYSARIHVDCAREMNKACRKNPVLRKALENKIAEIVQNLGRYKPLRNIHAGEYLVHILKSFVLKFTVEENGRTVSFIAFDHHDDAYRR